MTILLASGNYNSILEGHGFSRAVNAMCHAALAAAVRFFPSEFAGESRNTYLRGFRACVRTGK
jgi:hypothetical protein